MKTPTEQANNALSEANQRLANNEAMLIGALVEAKAQFAYYGKNHRTKAEGFRHKANGEFMDDAMKRENLLEEAISADDKAEVNEGWVEKIDNLLVTVGYTTK